MLFFCKHKGLDLRLQGSEPRCVLAGWPQVKLGSQSETNIYGGCAVGILVSSQAHDPFQGYEMVQEIGNAGARGCAIAMPEITFGGSPVIAGLSMKKKAVGFIAFKVITGHGIQSQGSMLIAATVTYHCILQRAANQNPVFHENAHIRSYFANQDIVAPGKLSAAAQAE